jgi:uncharacterized membrane protein
MLDGYFHLIAATLAFVGGHFLLSHPALRPKLAGLASEKAFSGVYSALMIAALIWMVHGFNTAPYIELWPTPRWTHFIPLAVMPVAVFLLVGGVTQYNPTLVNMEFAEEREDPAPGILKVTRHPVMWAIGLWALSHIPANGDLRALIFFGGLAALALYGTVRLDEKRRARDPNGYSRFAAQTSNVPFQAVAEGRTSFSLLELGVWRILVIAAVYMALFALHPWIAGAPIY